MAYQPEVTQLLKDISAAVRQGTGENCCKQREIITLLGGGQDTTTVLPGMVILTSGGTASFTTATTLQGTQYTSISLSVVSLSTGTVTVTDAVGSTDVSYVGFSTGWEGPIGPGLSVHVTGDAIIIISYLAV